MKEAEKAWKVKYLESVKASTERDDKITEFNARIAQLEAALAQKVFPFPFFSSISSSSSLLILPYQEEKLQTVDTLNRDFKIKFEKQEAVLGNICYTYYFNTLYLFIFL